MSESNTNNRLLKFFEHRKNKNGSTHESDGDKVMSLFLTAGYPDLESTADLVLGFEKNGADIIELGMPFSDPLADGPTIQFASNEAIQNGITMEGILSMVREVRKSSDIPIILMGYINPILKFGIESFCEKASDAGADGLIIPDVTLEESALITGPASSHGLSLVYLVAPNTSSERMRKIDDLSRGFVYCVSVTGVTGAREGSEIAESVQRFINRVNENVTKNPKLIGFGIRSYEDARLISEHADGFIVGSALIDEIRKNYPQNGWKEEVYKFVKHLKFGNIK